MPKSSTFKSPLRPSGATATASVPDTSRETESEMEISKHQMLLVNHTPFTPTTTIVWNWQWV